MAAPTLLNNITHKDLKVLTAHTLALSESTMMALAIPFEFKSLQNEYAIVFRKDVDGGTFQPVVLLGLEDNENLYLNEQGWDAEYIPLMIERQPFLIGQQHDQTPVLLIDMDSPKVSTSDGQPLFLPHGGNSDYLEHVQSILHAIHERQAESQAFIDALVQHQLIESFFLDVELENGQQHRLTGFFTINEDKLAALAPDVVAGLHQSGILQQIYMVVASLVNFRYLIKKKQASMKQAEMDQV